jgi:hypothetical protein
MEAGFSHFNRHTLLRVPHASQQAPIGSQHDRGCIHFAHEHVRNATGGAPASVEHGAVWIPEPKACCCVITVQYDSKLVKPNASIPITEPMGDLACYRVDLAARVDDDEIIAMCMHLYEMGRHKLGRISTSSDRC